MADKLKMETKNLAEENYKKLIELFPNIVTETTDENGNVVRAIDADILQQEINEKVVEGSKERYQFTWPDKKRFIALGNEMSTNTLRLDREKSTGRDGTEGSIDTGNIYIEGDNLEALKLLRETYLGKIKMIYIDPPYNTGNDSFVYDDDSSISEEEFEERSGTRDEEGNLIYNFKVNNESNGRFHTDWLNMMYPRLSLSKDLLSDDGAIFISIDDNEQENLKRICDEIFGVKNFVVEFIWKCRNSLQHDEPLVSKQTERILLYVKNRNIWSSESGIKFNRVRKPFDATEYKNPDNDPRGPWLSSGKTRNDGRPSYTVVSPAGVSFTRPWIPSKEEFKKWEEEGLIWWGKDGKSIPRKKAFLKDFKGNAISDILFDEYTDEIKGENELNRVKRWEIGTTESGTKSVKELFDGRNVFNYPKPYTLVKYLATICTTEDSLVLDFFSGSASTAHAVMQLNAEDGGHRKFIMVQLPEECSEGTEAYKAGYKNICEIGEERIRRAGKKIKEESPLTTGDLDIGFRVYRVDDSNMKDVYYKPSETAQDMLETLAGNIKEDRTGEDLLVQIMLELGVDLSSKIEEMEMSRKKVFSVSDGYMMACFDNDVTDDVVTQIAKTEPYYAVFRDSGMASDSVMTNYEQIFKTYSPKTIVKVL